MIYLKNTPDAQVLFVPRNGERIEGEMDLRLENTTDHQEIDLQVSDIETSGLYFNLAVTLPEGVASGEYGYRLEKDGISVSSGLLSSGICPLPIS